MAETVQRIVVLGSTLTALAIVRHCHALSIECVLVQRTRGPASDSRIPQVVDVSDASDSQILDCVISLGMEKPTALIADSDGWLQWVKQYRKELDGAFSIVLHPSSSTLDLCLNKTSFLGWCHKQGLGAPRVYSADLGWEEVEFPVLVRPEQTRHGKSDGLPKAIEIANPQQLSELLIRYEAVGAEANVSQSLLRPRIRQFSVGAARNRSANTALLVCEKVRPSAAMCGGGTYVISRPDSAVREFAVRALDELDYFGIAELEILKDESTGELFLIEINARPWVQYALSWQSGFDFLTFLLNPDCYREPASEPRNVAWLNFVGDLYVVFSRSDGMLRRRELKVTEYLSTLVRTRLFAVWSWRDPWPFVLSTWRLMRDRIKRSQ